MNHYWVTWYVISHLTSLLVLSSHISSISYPTLSYINLVPYFIHPPIHPSTQPPNHPRNYPYPHINPPYHPSTQLSIHPSTHPHINPPYHPSTQLSIHPSTHPLTHYSSWYKNAYRRKPYYIYYCNAK